MINKIIYLIVGFLIINLGISIVINKKLPQGHNGQYYYITIGDWAYLVGGLLIVYGIYIVYNIFKKIKRPFK